MKLTDGKKVAEVRMQVWTGSGYGPDWSYDFFVAGVLTTDDATGASVVADVDYCIDQAQDWGDKQGDYAEVAPWEVDEERLVCVTEEQKKEDTMKTTLNNLERVRYYAFTSEPWAIDADGYAEAAALIDYERRPWYIRWDGDTPVARKGYTLVKTDRDEWYAIRSNDIYTVVWEDDRLQGGFGKNCPIGGVSATWGYDIVQEIDGERVLLQRGGW